MRELLRVTKENQEILKRITARKPEYDHKVWKDDWEEKQAFIDNISSYPQEWWKENEKVNTETFRMYTLYYFYYYLFRTMS